MADNWKLYGADTVAYRLDKSELPGWARKDVVVGPNEGAIVIRDGKPEEMVTESKQKIQGFITGLMEKLFGWITGRAEVQVVMVDLGPIRLPIYIGETSKREEGASETKIPDGWIHARRASEVAIQAVTADKEVVSAEVLMTVMVNDADPARFIGMLKSARSLSRWDLAALVRDEIVAAVLVPAIASQKAGDLRGNKALAESIASSVRSDMEASLRGWGLVLSSFTIGWGLTDSERVQISIRRQELGDQLRKFAHERRLVEMGRDLEYQRTRIGNLQELKVAEAEGNEKLKDMLLGGELRREALVEGRRVVTAKVDAEVRVVQLDLEEKESRLRLERRRAEENMRLDIEERQWRQDNQQRLAQIDADDKELRSMVQMQVMMAGAKHEREMSARRMELDGQFRKLELEITTRYEERKIRLQEDLARMSTMKEVLTAGLSSGAVNAGVMSTFLSESTKQSFGTTSDQKATAMFNAEAAKGSLETYKQAEDRDRAQQKDMTKLSTDMMGAAKQSFGPQVVLGGVVPATGPQMPTMPQMPAPAPAQAPLAADVEGRLEKLKKLRDQGLIDDEEYKKRKAAILEQV
jgi:hypothetical protein